MTVSSSTARVNYSGNGVTVAFAVPFYFLSNSHLAVTLRSSTGVETPQVLNTDYTVTGAGVLTGGTVTMTVAPASGATLVIVRDVPFTQETDLQPNDRLPAETLEQSIDKLTMITQQIDEATDRTLKFPVTDSSSLSATIPSSTSRANKFLGFDSSGAPVATAGPTLPEGFVNVRSFGAVGDGVANDTTAIANAIATGKSVFFPAGTYRTGLQTVATVGQTIFGEGQNSVILAITPTTNLFNVTANYVTFQDLRMNGAATAATNTTFAIFTATATPVGFLTVQRVLFSGNSASTGFNNAIKFDNNCNGGTVIDCMFERLIGTASGFGYGVLCAGNQSTIAFNWFDGSSNRGRHAVYITAGASDCVVTGNYVTGFRFEAITQFATVTPCFRNIFSNNIVTASATIGSFPIGAMGIYGKSANAIIANNIVAGSGSCGIVLDGTGSGGDLQNTIISGNHISASALIGLEVMGATAGEIIGNKIYESSTSSAGTYSNIRLVSDGTTGTSGFLVSGNHSAGPTSSRSAFQLNSTAPTPTNLTVTGNQFEACNLTTIELSGVVTPIDGRIMFRQDSVAYGPITDGESANATYTVNGVDQGDICTVSHTNAIAGVSFFAAATATDTVVVTVSNLSGGSASISSGSLRIDAWKRPPGFL